MSDPIREFETACEQAGVTPTAAFRAGGLNPSTWFRWKSEAASPTLRSLRAAREGLEKLASGEGVDPSAASVALENPGEFQ